jgi:hypothetical protein
MTYRLTLLKRVMIIMQYMIRIIVIMAMLGMREALIPMIVVFLNLIKMTDILLKI